MMFYKKLSMLAACFFLTAASLHAQNDADVLRYSMVNWGSTARTLGMANAFGALGADPSSMATNPGGLGLYRRSEFTFSPGFQIRNTTSSLSGNSLDKNNFKFNFGNIALLWAFPQKNENSDWRGWTFGIGYNKLNDFNAKGYTEGVNNNNSLLESWAQQANGVDSLNFPDQFPFDVDLAWLGYLLDRDTAFPNNFVYQPAIHDGGALQRRTFEAKGNMGEFDISFGTNYKDKLFFGGTIGIVSVRYREDVTWEEVDRNNTIASGYSPYDFRSYRYTESIRTDGSGFNFKFGVIFKPVEYLRLGAAVHTPTFLSLTDDYKTTIASAFESGVNFQYASPEFLPFEYDISTPFRAIGSIGLVIGKFGLLSADYEFLDYSNGDISPRDDLFASDFIDINRDIQRKYTTAHNFRVGGELRYDKLRFRLGGSIYNTPFASTVSNDTDTDQSRYSINGGFGFREQNFYFDAGYAYMKSGEFRGIYAVNNAVTGVSQTAADHRLMFTFGFNF